ncbi:uncharacterized protein [Amphiura filiformis]|uniref:uncharacterized protein n=1 Tax=Amphiura filiformis TaxID=82378 RepID=UPI003B220E69
MWQAGMLLLLGQLPHLGVFGEETNEQNEFIFNIPYLEYATHPPHVLMTTSSLLPIDTTLTIPGLGYQVDNTISRDNPGDIRLSTYVAGIDVRLLPGDRKQPNKSVIVRASGQILLFVIENEFAQSDGFKVLPTSGLGTKYYIASYKPPSIYPSFFCISSVYSNTSINITTPTGQKHHIILKRHESYRYDGGDYEDLSGIFVESNKPIAVISGVFTEVHEGECCEDGLMEQLPPVHSWGYNFTLTPFLSLNSGYVYRVYSAIHSATLHMSDGNITHITAESFYEADVTGDTIVSFTSDQPIMVVQYMKSFDTNNPYRGDPSMLIVTPSTLYSADVTFPVIEYTLPDGHTYYINVVIKCDYLDGFLLDEAPLVDSNSLHTFDNSMCCLRSNVSTGHHTISHTNPMARFSVTVYAICKGYCASSYAYPVNAFGLTAESHSTQAVIQQPTIGMTSSAISTNNIIDGSSTITIIIAVSAAAVGVVVTIAIVAIVVYCRRKSKTDLSASSTHIPPNVQDPNRQEEEQYDDTGTEIPLDNMGYESIGDNRDKERKHDQGISGYSTYITPNEQEPVEDQYDDTGVEIPLDNMGYESLGADRDIDNYQGLYADIPN